MFLFYIDKNQEACQKKYEKIQISCFYSLKYFDDLSIHVSFYNIKKYPITQLIIFIKSNF